MGLALKIHQLKTNEPKKARKRRLFKNPSRTKKIKSRKSSVKKTKKVIMRTRRKKWSKKLKKKQKLIPTMKLQLQRMVMTRTMPLGTTFKTNFPNETRVFSKIPVESVTPFSHRNGLVKSKNIGGCTS